MATLSIELPPQRTQTEANLRRWEELLRDPIMTKYEGRVETDRHGQVIMSPPAAANHGAFQFRIGVLLDNLLPAGRVFSECPISTADGVRASDVAWASLASVRKLGKNIIFLSAPEICVEVISPGNTKAEIREKTALYFDAGAKEVWHCSATGTMTFFAAGESGPVKASQLCPEFPVRVQLR